MFKTCTKCNTQLSLDNFHKLNKGKYGTYPQCKLCRKLNKKLTNDKKIILKDNIIDLTCFNCGLIKPKSEFYKNNNSNTGFQIYCKICNKEKIAISMSNLQNYTKIILKKFKNKNKDKKININSNDVIKLYREQEGLCYITKHELTHEVDIKQRTDNIWNLSIIIKDDNSTEINNNDILLVCNLIYTTKKKYHLDENEIKDVYNNIINN